MSKVKASRGQLNAIFCITILSISTILCFLPILFIGVFKLIPYKPWQTHCTRCIDAIATFWSGINNFFIEHTQSINWEVSGLSTYDKHGWYLVTANHQSWLDIVVLHKLFNKKIPVLKFFIKDQLKWVPLLGFAWWAMGCPFMKRYPKQYLEKKPHKRHKDFKSTKNSIALFKRSPTSIINFIEGTRFRQDKKIQQDSPYQHLLKPRAGGISYVIATMGKNINSILDVTILYPEGNSTLWGFLCRRIHNIKVKIRNIPIPQEYLNADILNNEDKQLQFRAWLNQQWQEKDTLISAMKAV